MKQSYFGAILVIILPCYGQQKPIPEFAKTITVKPQPTLRLKLLTSRQRQPATAIATSKSSKHKYPNPYSHGEVIVPESMITLVSSDGKEFKVPLESALQAEYIKTIYRVNHESGLDLERVEFTRIDNILGPELGEVAQLMQMMYQHKNFTQQQLLEKAEKAITIRDPFEFGRVATYLGFKLGIELIFRKCVMKLIKEIAPPLHIILLSIDPTGVNHINMQSTGASVVASEKDGLPEISISSDYLQLPKNELRAALAHELSHYVLGHFTGPILTHKALQRTVTQEFKKGKKVRGQLSFEETFNKSFSRAQELEADRFSVVELGIPIDDAIAWAKERAERVEEHRLKMPEKETFKTTHPLWAARIKQFEDLRAEVELNKAHRRKPMHINWKDLAQNYLKEWQQKYPEFYS